MRGRRPSGPEYVDLLTGSPQAKERLKTVLETLAGTCRVQEACARLGISEPRFNQLRVQVLEAALDQLEPRAKGRPAKTLSPAEAQVEQLQQELADKEVELRAAQAREEIALVLPRALQEAHEPDTTTDADDANPAGPEKKTHRASQLQKLRRRPPATNKPT